MTDFSNDEFGGGLSEDAFVRAVADVQRMARDPSRRTERAGCGAIAKDPGRPCSRQPGHVGPHIHFADDGTTTCWAAASGVAMPDLVRGLR